jgi:uncharacterized protein (DUF342 family)
MSYNLFTDGGSIYNIFGELTTNPSNAINLSSNLGSNVRLDGDRIVAETTGYPYVDEENRICVVDNLTYADNINNLRVPITLAASLTVNGSILNAQINIMKNLNVQGSIKHAEIYSEGCLWVAGDIIECQASGIVVLQDLKVNNILDSLVICKGKLSFEELISGSRVIADGQLLGNFNISSIVGSHIQTSGSVDAASIGNSDGVETELEITISPFTKERLTGLTKTLIKLKESPETNAGKIEQVNDELHNLEIQLSDDLDIFLKTEQNTTRYIKAHVEIFKGVNLRILKRVSSIKQYQTDAVFVEEDLT